MTTPMNSLNTSADNRSPLQVLTFVMTIEYNGFQYAGFQRQSATPRITTSSTRNNVGNETATATATCDKTTKNRVRPASSTTSTATSTSSRPKKYHSQQSTSSSRSFSSQHQQQQQQPPNKKAKKKTSTPITIQHQIEVALQKWTSLSTCTLRVRGAGRTDKGVHASGQVVAFDVPLALLHVENEVGRSVANEGRDGKSSNEVLSEQSMPLLHEAYGTLATHDSKTNNTNETRNATKTTDDQWQIRRAITTRLPSDIVLRSVRIWTGVRPFETRQEIICKTYIYKLRFRCCQSELYHHDGGSTQSSSSASVSAPAPEASHTSQHNEHSNGTTARLLQLHPICNAGPHILRRIHDQNTVWLCPWSLDSNLLRGACDAFVGKHDFFNFVHKEERKKSSNNNYTGNSSGSSNSTINEMPSHEIDLFQFKVDTQPEQGEDCSNPTSSLPSVINATFTLKAKGFHRSMVRNLVGFVVDVARGVRSVEDVPVLLLMEKKAIEEESCANNNDSDNKPLASMVNSAPACGLCLAKVEYEHDNFL